jgi:hypothetical protein
MRNAPLVLLGLLGVLAVGGPASSQEPGREPATLAAACADALAGWSRPSRPCCGAQGCFPRCGCPDDYCPQPFPRQCWPPYPPFYQCVPAGDCAGPGCRIPGREKLTWWFIPTPRALREAIWWQP